MGVMSCHQSVSVVFMHFLYSFYGKMHQDMIHFIKSKGTTRSREEERKIFHEQI